MKLAAIVLVMLVACSKKQEDKPAPPVPPGAPASAAAAAGSAPAPAATSAMTSPRDEALAAYESKQWAKCVELYAKIDRPDARYNAACCLALDGRKDDAFQMLDRVLADGFRDLEHLKKDTDLASLHGDPRWPKFVAAALANVTKFEASLKEPALRKELLALREEDQAARQALIKNMNDQAAKDRVGAIDTKATTRMKEIVAKHGWPGKSLVGEDGANTAWLLVQHADKDRAFQKQCLALLETAYKAGEARERDYAYLYDRVAVAEDKPQRYGTQFKDGKPQPIEDEANVDARRKAIGLNTMAEYAKDMERMYGKQQPPAGAGSGSGSGSAK
ncbi:MAG TPA: DUF6624 domain-containing protein [Kofleriaceae bacterium]|nr:DUF6624 domain-containing protein [Kofleriaceae bacterium]